MRIQGNLDPTVTLPFWEAIEAETNRVLAEAAIPGTCSTWGTGFCPIPTQASSPA